MVFVVCNSFDVLSENYSFPCDFTVHVLTKLARIRLHYIKFVFGMENSNIFFVKKMKNQISFLIFSRHWLHLHYSVGY